MLSRLGRHGVRRAAAGLALGLVATLAVATAVRPTSASWSTQAYLRAAASSGSWLAVNTCQVRNADGSIDTSKPCTVELGDPAYWGSHGSGQGNFSSTLRSRKLGNTQYFVFTLAIPDAPSWWVWSASSAITSDNFGTVTSSCGELPTFSGRTDPNRGDRVNVYVAFEEVRGASPALCTS